MKVFAFLLAFLFSFQVATPVICATGCESDVAEKSLCCAAEVESQETCSTRTSCCSQGEMSACDEEKSNQQENEAALPHAKNCCTPCCSAPLCCGFLEEVRELNFSLKPVLVAGTFPSNNGIPVSGYLSDCWQPPEFI